MKNKKIKILVDSMMIAPNPFFAAREVLSRKINIFKFLGKRNDSLNELDQSFWHKNMYDGIELNYPGIGFFDEDWNVREDKLLEYKKSNYPFYTFHGCFDSFPKKYRGLHFNLASGDGYVQKALKSQIDVASSLKKDEKTILVFHPGVAEDENKKKGLNNIIHNLEFCLDYAKERGVIITLENINWNPSECTLGYYIDDFEYIFRKLNHESLKICFDVGHLNTLVVDKNFRGNRNIKQMEHCKDFIEALSENIVHAHLHYNTCHLNYDNNSRVLRKIFFDWICERDNGGYLDEHMSLNKADDIIFEVIGFLMNKSEIKNYGYLTCEFMPKRIFRFIKLRRGADIIDHRESLELLRKMI